MELSILTDHLLISLVAWVGGLIVGGGAGYLLAGFVHSLVSTKPDIKRMITLVPWRTLTFMLILVVWSPFLGTRLGLGNLTGIIMVGLTISLVAWPMAMKTLLDDWFPPSLRVSLISKARTLLLLALFATLGVGFVGAGGFGFYLVQQVNFLEYGKLFEGLVWLGGLALVLDVLLGVIEYRATLDAIHDVELRNGEAS